MLLVLALLIVSIPALAEVWTGTTVALDSVSVVAQADGTVAAVQAEVGQRVEAGDSLVALRSEKAFASQDGTVSIVSAEAGSDVDGEVLKIAPVERYTVYCSVDGAYQSAASTLVHGGETVYIKCTSDGTHRAVGTVAQVDGGEYRVLTLGGELYVGETVYLYRDADFTASGRIGIGTVLASDAESYTAQGRLTRLCVEAGDTVERGQLLYEVGGGEIAVTETGILTGIACQPGETVAEGQVVATLVPEDAVGVEIEVDETEISHIAVGDTAQLLFAGQEDEEAVFGTVIEIRDSDEAGAYRVWIRPATLEPLPLGMSVEVRI